MTEAHETQKQKTGVGTVQRPGLKAKAAERPCGAGGSALWQSGAWASEAQALGLGSQALGSIVGCSVGAPPRGTHRNIHSFPEGPMGQPEWLLKLASLTRSGYFRRPHPRLSPQ